MGLIVKKALNLQKKKYIKTSKIEPSLESLNADFFQFSAKIIKSFVLGSYLTILL